MAETFLPHYADGEVVKGFGRGSKELGIPTANFPEDIVEKLPADLPTGVYYGWANVDGGDVHKMCMSVGWNPYYKNTKKTMETHIMHQFPEDFYGSRLKIVMVGYIRPMSTFASLDELITAIRNDISETDKKLDEPEVQHFKVNNFFATS
ncbi:riboflavin kinase-like [Haliotis cracherodii]|uniref:riboflavin kinase-like n=1 Tax=Haliotis cracherodii TaxID=6455 RepID=UPI0039EC17FD